MKKSKVKNDGFHFGEYLEIFIACVVILVILVIAIGLSVGLASESEGIAPAVIRDINIALITAKATLIGLYVTAFIFLNDSLKSRVKEDVTVGDAVDRILRYYRRNMYFLAIFTIVAIVCELMINLTLNQDGETTLIALNDWRWISFLIVAAVAIAVITWIIISSRDITNSDDLIYKRSESNRIFYSEQIKKHYDDIKDKAKELEKGMTDKDGFFTGDDISLSGKNLFDMLTEGDGDQLKLKPYSFGHAYIKSKDEELLKGADEEDLKKLAEQSPQEFARRYREYEIELGKIIRLLENRIGKISDNNIDKSIMNNEYKIDSIKNGFLWLYGQDPTKIGEQGSSVSSVSSVANIIDVRDDKRFLDYVKYQIITHPTFKDRPFNNQEVERVFTRIKLAFEEKSFKDKKTLIRHYKDDMRTIIEDFFAGYRCLIGYRDAMVHLKRYGDEENFIEESDMKIGIVINYAKILKRVLLDRFVSFVRTDELNLGNSTMDKSWFNFSELSNGNFTHSTFRYSCLEHAIFRKCDLSTSSFVMADASNTDFSGSNFNYSDLTGMELDEAILNNAQLSAVILRDARIDSYGGLSSLIGTGLDHCENEETGKRYKALSDHERARIMWRKGTKSLSAETQKFGEEAKSDTNEAFLAECRKLRAGDMMSDLVPAFTSVQSKLGKVKTILDSYQNGADVTFLKYENGEVKGTVLDEVYDILFGKDNGHLKDYYKYRKYSKINDELFNSFDELRYIEENEEAQGDMSFKEARESTHGKVYFRVANLQNASINDVGMPATDFSHINMSKASFRNSDLSGSDMYYTNASDVMFSQANLSDLDAYRTSFNGANLSSSILLNANLVECNLNNINAKKALLLNSVFIGMGDPEKKRIFLAEILKNKNVSRNGEKLSTHLQKHVEGAKGVHEIEGFADHSDISGMDSDFSLALANGIVMMNLNLMRGRFIKTNMSSALLFNDVFIYASMMEADLSNALIFGGSFHQANCSDIILQRAILFGCEFSNANLQNALFNSALLTRCTFDQTNLSKVNFSRSNVSNCAFVKCNFAGMNLAGTVFKNTIFIEYNFEDAIGLDEVEFVDCSFQGPNNHVEQDEQLYLTRNAQRTVTLYRSDIIKNGKTNIVDEPPTFSSKLR